LNWVKFWMTEALLWAGVQYLRGKFPTKVWKMWKWSTILDAHLWWQKDCVDGYWTQHLEARLRSIDEILEVGLPWGTLENIC
jgi:hypothetical protein